MTANEAINTANNVQTNLGLILNGNNIVPNGGTGDISFYSEFGSISLTSDGNDADAIKLQATVGGISLTTSDDKAITFNTGTDGKIQHTSDANGEDFTIEQAGNNDSSLLLKSAGSGTDAIGLTAKAFGITLNAAGNKPIIIGNTDTSTLGFFNGTTPAVQFLTTGSAATRAPFLRAPFRWKIHLVVSQ